MAITIIPDNAQQENVIRAFLKEMKINFIDSEKIKISKQAKKSILKGIEDAENGNTISEKEAYKSFEDAAGNLD